jgi:hypothetical protein
MPDVQTTKTGMPLAGPISCGVANVCQGHKGCIVKPLSSSLQTDFEMQKGVVAGVTATVRDMQVSHALHPGTEAGLGGSYDWKLAVLSTRSLDMEMEISTSDVYTMCDGVKCAERSANNAMHQTVPQLGGTPAQVGSRGRNRLGLGGGVHVWVTRG